MSSNAQSLPRGWDATSCVQTSALHEERPERYLVIAGVEITGVCRLAQKVGGQRIGWLFALSEYFGQQEAMLLLPACGWVRTDLGRFVLEGSDRWPWIARLVLCGGR